MEIKEIDQMDGYLNNGEKTTLRYLIHASYGRQEWGTSAFTNYLISEMDLNKTPFYLAPEPNIKFTVPTVSLSSRPDFAIFFNDIIKIIVENKIKQNIRQVTGYGEFQVAGEMVAAALFNQLIEQKIYEQKYLIYGIRIIDTHFTFYRLLPNISYYNQLMKTPNKLTDLTIETFGRTENPYGYDFLNPSHRKIILRFLKALQNHRD